jgi:hypothetical protein
MKAMGCISESEHGVTYWRLPWELRFTGIFWQIDKLTTITVVAPISAV